MVAFYLVLDEHKGRKREAAGAGEGSNYLALIVGGGSDQFTASEKFVYPCPPPPPPPIFKTFLRLR